MAEINLNKARAARAEGREKHTVHIGKARIRLPDECPAEFAFLLRDDDLRSALQVLLGESYEKFMAQGTSMEDLYEFAEQVAKVYGFDSVGESLASEGSSQSITSASRLTSSGTTG